MSLSALSLLLVDLDVCVFCGAALVGVCPPPSSSSSSSSTSNSNSNSNSNHQQITLHNNNNTLHPQQLDQHNNHQSHNHLFNDELYVAMCGHVIHRNCVISWTGCPVCDVDVVSRVSVVGRVSSVASESAVSERAQRMGLHRIFMQPIDIIKQHINWRQQQTSAEENQQSQCHPDSEFTIQERMRVFVDRCCELSSLRASLCAVVVSCARHGAEREEAARQLAAINKQHENIKSDVRLLETEFALSSTALHKLSKRCLNMQDDVTRLVQLWNTHDHAQLNALQQRHQLHTHSITSMESVPTPLQNELYYFLPHNQFFQHLHEWNDQSLSSYGFAGLKCFTYPFIQRELGNMSSMESSSSSSSQPDCSDESLKRSLHFSRLAYQNTLSKLDQDWKAHHTRMQVLKLKKRRLEDIYQLNQQKLSDLDMKLNDMLSSLAADSIGASSCPADSADAPPAARHPHNQIKHSNNTIKRRRTQAATVQSPHPHSSSSLTPASSSSMSCVPTLAARHSVKQKLRTAFHSLASLDVSLFDNSKVTLNTLQQAHTNQPKTPTSKQHTNPFNIKSSKQNTCSSSASIPFSSSSLLHSSFLPTHDVPKSELGGSYIIHGYDGKGAFKRLNIDPPQPVTPSSSSSFTSTRPAARPHPSPLTSSSSTSSLFSLERLKYRKQGSMQEESTHSKPVSMSSIPPSCAASSIRHYIQVSDDESEQENSPPNVQLK